MGSFGMILAGLLAATPLLAVEAPARAGDDPIEADRALPPGASEEDLDARPTLGVGKQTRVRVAGVNYADRVYDEQLRLIAEERLRGEARHGPRRTWYPDGKLRTLVTYQDDVLDGPARAWGPDGRILWQTTLVGGAGVLREFRPDGSLAKETPYRGGVPHGTQRTYHPDGSLATSIDLLAGRRDGWTRFYHPNGQLETELYNVAGQAHGVHRHWDQAGKLTNPWGRTPADTPPDWNQRDLTPYYIVHGRRVTRDAYDRAAAADPLLARVRGDDSPVGPPVAPTFRSFGDPFDPVILVPRPPADPPK